MEVMILVFALCVAVVNIITQLSKEIITYPSTNALNACVLVISEVVTVAAFSAYWVISGNAFAWYVFAAFVVAGILAAYAAMFGYDKLLKQLFAAIENYKSSLNSEDE